MARNSLARNSLGAQASRLQKNKGWYYRGYLPHFDHPSLVQMITFRLNDALPADTLREIEEGLRRNKYAGSAGVSPAKSKEMQAGRLRSQRDAVKRQRIESYLDAGHGSCSLRDPRIASLVEDAFFHFDGRRYRLIAWVVMPNHVHVLIEILPGYRLMDIVHSWKSFTAKEANKILGRTGDFWQTEYFDRYIRDASHFESAVRYIHENPVKAGLAPRAEDWPFSSASASRKNAGETPALPGGIFII